MKNLQEAGINVEIFKQTIEAPDSIFPDWFVTARNPLFPDGVLILSAMRTPERRREREPVVIESLKSRYKDVIDLTVFEEQELALELKGALVTDWANGKIYCSLSNRASEEVFAYLISKLNKIAKKQGSN
jgi:hypothetical protein